MKIKIDIIAFSSIIRGKRKAQQAKAIEHKRTQAKASEHKRTQAKASEQDKDVKPEVVYGTYLGAR
jgi:hypothetical protein